MGQLGIYGAFNGGLTNVIDLNGALFDKTPQSLGFFDEGLSGTALAFFAQLTDGTQAIVRADAHSTPAVPEPRSLSENFSPPGVKSLL